MATGYWCTCGLPNIQRRANFASMKFLCLWGLIMDWRKAAAVFALLIFATSSQAAGIPQVENDFVITNFHFRSGQTLPELRMHYLTFGKPERDRNGVVRNAVLILHGTTGNCGQFLNPAFADELFSRGQPLDVARYYLIIPDGIGHGKSSKPSDGLRAKFPNYGYQDMVEAQYRLVTEGLGVNHLRLVMGTSMGGMHTWLWGEKHPDFMDALMPLASLPTQISGRNRIWRRMIIDSIHNSPDWQNGDYQSQPSGLRVAAEMLYFMGENPVMRMNEGPTEKRADEMLDHYVANAMTRLDANDVLYAVSASSDYDPAPELDKIKAPLLAVNSADDLINPPELGVLEHGVKQVKNGQTIVIPYSSQTVGHGSHTKAVLWKKDLAGLLQRTEKKSE
jgi:homoserine O-acetyltransferase/O-succinyltransferase